jgi:hypothetical protein
LKKNEKNKKAKNLFVIMTQMPRNPKNKEWISGKKGHRNNYEKNDAIF